MCTTFYLHIAYGKVCSRRPTMDRFPWHTYMGFRPVVPTHSAPKTRSNKSHRNSANWLHSPSTCIPNRICGILVELQDVIANCKCSFLSHFRLVENPAVSIFPNYSRCKWCCLQWPWRQPSPQAEEECWWKSFFFDGSPQINCHNEINNWSTDRKTLVWISTNIRNFSFIFYLKHVCHKAL